VGLFDGDAGEVLDLPTAPGAAEEENGDGVGNSSGEELAEAPGGEQRLAGSRETLPGAQSVPAGQGAAVTRGLQLIGIEGTNPILSYKGRYFTCHWTSTIGTDMFFARPTAIAEATEEQPVLEPDDLRDSEPENEDPAPIPPILRSLGSHDLLGLNSVRLVAVPAIVRPRKPKHTSLANIPPDVGMKIPVATLSSNDRIQQARFLERFSAVRFMRGESASIPIAARLANGQTAMGSAPGEIRNMKPLSYAAHNFEFVEDNLGEDGINRGRGRGKPGRPRKKRGTGRWAQQFITHHHHPSPQDPGPSVRRAASDAEQRMPSIPTPHTWDELEVEAGPSTEQPFPPLAQHWATKAMDDAAPGFEEQDASRQDVDDSDFVMPDAEGELVETDNDDML